MSTHETLKVSLYVNVGTKQIKSKYSTDLLTNY